MWTGSFNGAFCIFKKKKKKKKKKKNSKQTKNKKKRNKRKKTKQKQCITEEKNITEDTREMQHSRGTKGRNEVNYSRRVGIF